MNNDVEEERNDRRGPPIISIGREEVVLDNANSTSTTKEGKKSHGFHLVRSKWDPYPWIESVDSESSANISGLRSGDCLLEVDGRDVLGLEMKDIGYLIGKSDRVNLSVWRRPPRTCPEASADLSPEQKNTCQGDSCEPSSDDNTGTLLEGPLPEVAQKLVRAVSGVVKALECPVCLESAAPPVSQCVHGHLLCFGCRLKTARCPVCRVRLGQGRCLLADKSHRVLTETLLDPPIDAEDGVSPAERPKSLRDSIFGPASATTKQPKSPSNRQQRTKSPSSMKQLLSKVLSPKSRRPNEDRNASTESLPTINCPADGNNLLYGRRWLLRLYDRRKSASTGELSKAPEDEADGRSRRFAELRRHEDAPVSENSGSLLSVPQTPIWGGSFESMTSSRLCCPMRERAASCRESLTSDNLLEHLSEQHGGPLVHFYRSNVSLPVPFPFREQQAVYVLHEKDEIFVLQNERNKVWMSNSETNCGIKWEWTFQGRSESGVEMETRKEVVSLREPFELLPYHVVTLPENFTANAVNISLIELNMDEGCIRV